MLKKITALLAAVSMVATMGITAMAAEETVAEFVSVTISKDADGNAINDSSYEVFTVKQKDDGSFVLVDKDGKESEIGFLADLEANLDTEGVEATCSYSLAVEAE